MSTLLDVAPVISTVATKAASTGSNGFFASAKVLHTDGCRYQVTIGSWLVGSKVSKAVPATDVVEVRELLSRLPLVAKVMKEKDGFYAGGKLLTSKGESLQTSIIATKIAA